MDEKTKFKKLKVNVNCFTVLILYVIKRNFLIFFPHLRSSKGRENKEKGRKKKQFKINRRNKSGVKRLVFRRAQSRGHMRKDLLAMFFFVECLVFTIYCLLFAQNNYRRNENFSKYLKRYFNCKLDT